MKSIGEQVVDLNKVHSGHYLVMAKNLNHNYWCEFVEAVEILKSVLTKREFEVWCQEKMMLTQQFFSEKTFIQYAVETAVTRFFAERFPKSFEVEARVNPNSNKNVDCQFIDNGYTFNIEVKCSDFVAKEKIDAKRGFKYGTVGRLDDRGAGAKKLISFALDEALRGKNKIPEDHLDERNMDNNLKEFLELAHGKFNPVPTEDEVNILVIGCDDCNDVQKWCNYLHATRGLFTRESFADRKKYQNVDIVVLTNQYFKHRRFFEKSVSSSWTLTNGFNLIFINPNRLLCKTQGIRHFLTILPNYNSELATYQVPGSAPNYVKDAVHISYFVKDFLQEKNHIYVFEDNVTNHDR